MISTAILLTLAAMLAETQRSAAARTYLMATAGALSLLIGLSRIYLGVHWPTDVLAGWCFGAVWALLVFAANRALRRRAARLPVGGPASRPNFSRASGLKTAQPPCRSPFRGHLQQRHHRARH